jgi:hypothetical protein
MRKKLAAASRKDRKERRKRQEAGENVEQQLLRGENVSADMQEHLKVSLEFIQRLRAIFAGKTLRRTIHSKDNNNIELWSLPAYVDITLRLRLSLREMTVIHQQAVAASQKENQDGLIWREVMHNSIRASIYLIVSHYRFSIWTLERPYYTLSFELSISSSTYQPLCSNIGKIPQQS